MTTSNASSSNGSSAASPSTQSTSTPASAAWRRAAGNHALVTSAPVTVAPRCAAGTATDVPLPVPTSSNRVPGEMGRRSSNRGPAGAISEAIASQSPADQTARLRSRSTVIGSGIAGSFGRCLTDRSANSSPVHETFSNAAPPTAPPGSSVGIRWNACNTRCAASSCCAARSTPTIRRTAPDAGR